jgi:hypothetical protein
LPRVLSLLVLAVGLGMSACSSSQNACNAFCTHAADCNAQPSSGCAFACTDPSAPYPYGGTCTDYTAAYDCLAALPCADFTGGSGADPSAVEACKTQGGCN